MFGQVMNGSFQRGLESLNEDGVRLGYDLGGENVQGMSQCQRASDSTSLLGTGVWFD